MTRKAVVIPIHQHPSFPEPTLDEILADSVTRAVMRADGVDPADLRVLLRRVGRLRAGDKPVAGEGDDFAMPGRSPERPSARCWGLCV